MYCKLYIAHLSITTFILIYYSLTLDCILLFCLRSVTVDECDCLINFMDIAMSLEKSLYTFWCTHYEENLFWNFTSRTDILDSWGWKNWKSKKLNCSVINVNVLFIFFFIGFRRSRIMNLSIPRYYLKSWKRSSKQSHSAEWCALWYLSKKHRIMHEQFRFCSI